MLHLCNTNFTGLHMYNNRVICIYSDTYYLFTATKTPESFSFHPALLHCSHNLLQSTCYVPLSVVEKSPLSLYSVQILLTIHSKKSIPAKIITLAVQFTTHPDFWDPCSK